MDLLVNAPAHVTPPEISGRLMRPRLLQRVDQLFGAGGARALWLQGAAGSGKSTLAAQALAARPQEAALWWRLDESDRDPAAFSKHGADALRHARHAGAEPAWPPLTREHLARPGLLLRQHFAALLAALPAPATLVLDDLQCLDEAASHWLNLLVAELRPGQHLWLLSHHDLPAALLDALAAGTLARLDARELAFDSHETAAWLAELGHAPAATTDLHQRSQGWPLTTALLAQPDGELLLQRWLEDRLWPQLDPFDQAALREATWLPTVGAAELGEAAAGRLARLARQGTLVDRCGAATPARYRLHSLLVQHLQRQQRACTAPAQLAATLSHHAESLEAQALDDAALGLRLQAAALEPACWPAADALLCRLAPRWLAQCRHASLRQSAQAVPEGLRSGRLWWWLAQAELPRSPAAARNAADRAIALLPQADAALAVQCHVLAIATHFQAFDDTRPLAERLAALRDLGVSPEHCDVRRPPDAALAVGVWSALFLRQPTHPACAAWQSRVGELMHESVDPNLKLRAAMLLAKQGWYTGRHVDLAQLPLLAQAALQQPGVSPYARLVWGLMRQYAAWASADWAAGLAATDEALADAEASGIHLLDQHLRLHGACFHSLQGDDAAAQALLAVVAERADASRHMEAWHHFTVRGWLSLRQGEWANAEAASQIAMAAAQAMGPAPHAMALAIRCHALQAQGQAEALQAARLALGSLAKATDNALALMHTRLIDARTALDNGDHDGALNRVQRALGAARVVGLWAPMGCEPRSLARLLNLALEAEIESEVALRMIQALRLAPPTAAAAAWPWPVRVHTLGRFALDINGQALAMTGKQQKRPLDLLQALIALGGEAAVHRLVDLLWPEAEGDLALSAFEVALRRLRQLLGDADALRLSGGRLALNPQRVWVDALAPDAAPSPAFLPDQDAPWAHDARLRGARRQALSL